MVRYNPQVENPFLRRGTSFTPTFLSNLGIIFLLGLLVYMNSLGGGFVYDDYAFIVNNPHIKTLSHPGRFFLLKTATSFSGHSIWRPLRTLSFAFDYHLWGLEPFGYHLTNVLFHIINGVLVYIIILRLGLAWRVALISSCLFLVHPLQTESVSWISSRGDCLFAAFFLLSLYWYMKGRIILSYLSFILSLFSKETALSLPLLLLAYDSLFIRPQFVEKRKNNITPSCQKIGRAHV